MIETNQDALRPASSQGLSWIHYLVGFSSLVPLLGLLTGLISLILGLVKIKSGGWKLILLGFLGYGVTFGIGYYYYHRLFVSHEGIMGEAWKKSTSDSLTTLVKDIEYFKMTQGQYPKDLRALPREAGSHTLDMMAMKGDFSSSKLFTYILQPGGETYYLFSTGEDGQIFTADDLFPQVDPQEESKVGYRQRPSDLAGLQSSPVPAAQAPAGDSSASDTIVWRTPADGLKEAEQTQKPMLYDITAEWCGPCHRLTSEVFENAECAARINQLFIPVRVMDRKREEGKNPEDIQAIEAKYGLTGFPTLVVQYPGKNGSKKLVGFYGKDGTMDFLNKALQ